MADKNKQASLFDEDLFFKSKEFYDIPLLGEVHIESDFENAGNYSLGEIIQNFKSRHTESLTLCAADDGLSVSGIFKGDFLNVNLNQKPKDHDIAAVRLGPRIYIRKIFYDRHLVRLEADAPEISTIIVDPRSPGFEIIGKVAMVIRTF